ncbi:conserved exported hypothetical protein [Bradyrhizobium sp. ORS 375]|nr:conserved exported hypothetical protein [Bradyrhizobium sp. ORS 375]
MGAGIGRSGGHRRRETNPLLAVCLVLSMAGPAVVAAEELVAPGAEDRLSPDSMISRDAWRQKVQQARERAEQARRESAARPREPAPPPPSPEQFATERVLGDETLQAGDVVSTGKGLFLFRGRSDDGGLILQPLPRPR